MVDQKMIQKRAKDLGLGGVDVKLIKFSGGAADNDALLSGAVDFAAGGVSSLLVLWDRTLGRNNVRAIASINDSPMFLVTTDPRIKSIRDFGKNDRIALPAPKISINATVLQMEATKLFGFKNAFKYDPLTVAMPNANGAMALITGSSEVKTHFATMPFTYEELKKAKGARVILTSYDVLGGEHSLILMRCTERWKDKNPRTFKAVALALGDAMQFIHRDKHEAAKIFIRQTGSKLSFQVIDDIISRPDFKYTMTPHKTMEFANFLYRLGTIKHKPKSWKDYFWEDVYDRDGS